MRRARVVLRAQGGKRHHLAVSDGSESRDSAVEADTMSMNVEPVHYNHSDWDTAPTISKDNELSPTGNNHVLHSTPLGHHSSSQPDIQPHSPRSSVPPAEFKVHPSSSSTDSDENQGDDESDDVFYHHPHPDNKTHARLEDKYNCQARSSGTLNTGLPPLPNMGTTLSSSSKKRPYTSPGYHGSSSTDSFPSPLHRGSSPERRSIRSRSSRSARSRRAVGRNRVHPEAKPKLAELSQPSPERVDHSSTFSHRASLPLQLDRFHSSSSSINSTFSIPVPPLLTSDLRRGGRNPSMDGSAGGGSWDFDAEAQLENCFPDKHIQVYVATWNMQEQKDLPASIDDVLLPLTHDIAADMYIIGTQESTPSRREWEVLIQQTLGPSYVLAQSTSLGIIYLLFYLRRDLIWYCSAVRSASYATRPGTLIKTKGGLGISFSLFGSSFLFVTSHFTAHNHKVAERNSDMQRIAANLALSDSSDKASVTDMFDHVFWFGDLNYRVELDREQADRHLANSDWMGLLMQDQLTREILRGNVFQGFSEQPILFPPSYKFNLNSELYDTSEKKRTPSWTDRILYKSLHRSGIIGCGYDCCLSLKTSDHRPVYGMFRVKLEPSKHIEGIPEQVVTFDRDIYLKAQKQRRMLAKRMSVKQMSLANDQPDGGAAGVGQSSRTVTSTVCSIL